MLFQQKYLGKLFSAARRNEKARKSLIYGLFADFGSNYFAESEGFEPPDLLQSTVFKTAAIDHSANSLS